MSKSGIPYVLNPDGTQGENWNPVSGCPEDQYNAICRDRCWARGQATRLPGAHGGYREVWHKNGLDVYRTTPEAVPFSELVYHPDRIDWPLHWVKPRTVFVGSMGDLFHEQVSEEFIVKVSRTIARARQHWYLLLTKRWRRMARLTHLMLPELRAAGDSIGNYILGTTTDTWYNGCVR